MKRFSVLLPFLDIKGGMHNMDKMIIEEYEENEPLFRYVDGKKFKLDKDTALYKQIKRAKIRNIDLNMNNNPAFPTEKAVFKTFEEAYIQWYICLYNSLNFINTRKRQSRIKTLQNNLYFKKKYAIAEKKYNELQEKYPELFF